jgi:predicted HicB family RNase H-like nuclease
MEPMIRRQQVELLHRIADANLAAFQEADNQDSCAKTDRSRRAAFTLRLDEERHLRLRLASTVKGESAQVLVTRALDRLLAQMPEIEQLAAQVKRDTNKA